MKRKRIVVLALSLIFLLSAATVFAADSGEITIVKDFYSDDQNAEYGQAEQTIEKDGKTYKLTDITYKQGEREKIVRETVDYAPEDKSSIPVKQTFTVNGKDVELKLEEDSIQTVDDIRYAEYTVEARERQPAYAEIEKSRVFTVDGEEKSFRLTPIGVEDCAYKISDPYYLEFTVSAEYTGDSNARYVKILGEQYPVDTVTPEWEGYETMLRVSLDLPETYEFTGASWLSNQAEGGIRTRTAQYTGVYPVRDYTYRYFIETPTIHAVYSNSEIVNQYHIEATLHYSLDSGISTIVLIGSAAVVILAIAAAVILSYLKRRKKEEAA